MPKSIIAMRLPGRKNTLPGCGSAWKKPSTRIIFKSASAPRAAEHLLVEPGGFHRRHIGARDAHDMVLDQQRLGGPLRMNLRNDDEGVVLEVRGDALHVGRLDREIELAFQRVRELGGDFYRLIAPRLGNLGVDERGEVAQEAQVGFDLGPDAGPADLEHDLRAVGELRAMHLGDRRRAVRARLEIGEHLERRAPQRARRIPAAAARTAPAALRRGASPIPRSTPAERGRPASRALARA